MQKPMQTSREAPRDAAGRKDNSVRLGAHRESSKNLKGNAQICATSVGIFRTLPLAYRSAMEHILEVIRKIKASSAVLAEAVSEDV